MGQFGEKLLLWIVLLSDGMSAPNRDAPSAMRFPHHLDVTQNNPGKSGK
jgi:hypothetical protein